MKLTVEVHHIVTLDPALMDLLKNIFPNQAAIDALTKEVKDKSTQLQTEITRDTPAT